MTKVKWLLIAWSILLVPIVLQFVLVSNYEEDYDVYSVAASIIGGYLSGCILIFCFIIPLHKVLVKYSNYKKIALLFFGGFFFSPIFIGLTICIQALFIGEISVPRLVDRYNTYLLYDFHNVYKNYIFLTAILFVLDYFEKESRLIKNENVLHQRLVKTELENLKNQFQPHFLFNSLNSVVAVIDENKQKAQSMLIQLSDILRISLNNDYQGEHTLGEEIAFVDKYLSIEKIRFENQLNYFFDIGSDTYTMQVPCLIMQPIIENAIKHGFRRNEKKIMIEIKTLTQERKIIIANNGAAYDGNNGFGHGLSGISDRLRLLYGDKAHFRIYQDGEWVINELQLK